MIYSSNFRLFFFGVCSPGIHDLLVHDTPSAKGRMPNMRISTLYFYQYDPNMPNSRTLCFSVTVV